MVNEKLRSTSKLKANIYYSKLINAYMQCWSYGWTSGVLAFQRKPPQVNSADTIQLYYTNSLNLVVKNLNTIYCSLSSV